LRDRLPPPDTAMEALKLLLTTDIGLLSLGAILFMIVMAIYMFTRFRKLMNQEPGKEGWN
jgi:flagellar biogenesis protein FliO